VNRETKLALIIGFAFVLMVGVLISDHLSAVHDAELADVTRGEEILDASPPPDPLAPVTTRDAGASDAAPEHRADDQRPDPRSRSLAASPGTMRLPPPLIIRQGAGSEPVASGQGTPLMPRQAEPDPVAPPQPPATPTRYRVRAGDSLYSIADDQLGEGTLWKRIRDANRDIVGDDGSLIRPGQVLTIPATGDSASAPIEAEPREPDASGSMRTYTVRPGDRLERIAIELLGSRARIDEILDLNADVIEDPDRIRAGMTLRIPAR